ncbi:transcription termination factor, mitochondrial isoform X2 [Daphnia magna]|uniref:Mitochondrial transcription termination factor n=2 Tax=Daphnia magna TaxID=35525 RepID=A0A0P5E612_9CRUS|nr:transcription termination factor, mitochondrial isoform X2 [Daphnia magna]KZS09212.1 Mitochondrial transcription termination factor [Daphnia magna]
MNLRLLLPCFFLHSKSCFTFRNFQNFIMNKSNCSRVVLPQRIHTNVFKNVIVRQISTCYQLLQDKTEKSLCLTKGDESYFDFKELECNSSAEQRMGHFMALMCEAFKLSEEEAEDIVECYPFLWKEFFHKSFTHLKSMGLVKTTFMQYPWLISMSPEEIDSKLQIVSTSFPDMGDVNTCACLFKYPNEKIDMLISNWKKEAVEFEQPSKFHFLAHALKVPIGKIMNQLETKSFLLSLSYSRIQEGVNICLDAGVQREDVLNDLWVLRNRPIKIRNRIETLLQSKIPVKPWVLRARIQSFKTYIEEYWEEKQDMEYDNNLSSYLMTRLKCELSVVERMMKVFPNLQRATIRKVKPNIDYLLVVKCIDPGLVIMTPRILCQKLDTVKDRIEILETTGIQYSSLWMVGRSQREFDDFVKRWKTK